LTAGALVSDNPFARYDVLKPGNGGEISWSGQGGGDRYAYYLSYNMSADQGVIRPNDLHRQSIRTNVTLAPQTNLSIDAGLGVTRQVNDQPESGDNSYNLLAGQALGSPLTVGTPADGWSAPYLTSPAIEAIINRLDGTRFTPTLQLSYQQNDRLTHRLTVGADVDAAAYHRYIPISLAGAYLGTDNQGSLTEQRRTATVYTLDYLGNFRTQLGTSLQSDLSFGAQVISEHHDLVTGSGYGFVTNSTTTLGAATTLSATGNVFDQRSIGLLAQEQLGYRNLLFLQAGVRVDRNSSFGNANRAFVLPKFGLSYVVSEHEAWKRHVPFISTLRLRTVYGTTGRAPTPGASLETFVGAPYALPGGGLGAGLVAFNPGNTNLRAERGEEFEAGADVAFFADRVGLEATYFNKRTRDLLLARPIPPSLGFTSNPFVNIGSVDNRGIELSLRATLIDRQNVRWESRLGIATLRNRLTSLGDVGKFGTGLFNVNQYRVGYGLGDFWGNKILKVDPTAGTTLVTDTAVFLGKATPTYNGSLSNNLTIGKHVHLSGLLEWRGGNKLWDLNSFARDRFFANSYAYQTSAQLQPADKLRQFGPYVNSAGAPVSSSVIYDDYIEDASFVRLRELSATLDLPRQMARLVRASRMSLTIGGQNLALWTRYKGGDPESAPYLSTTGVFYSADVFALPQPKRAFARLAFNF
jgi:hypothetical protein